MRKALLILLSLAIVSTATRAQIINGQDTLYGNEWIHFDQTYFKIMLAEDGIYRLTSQDLTSAGVPLAEAAGSQFQLFHNGEEVPVYVTTDGTFGDSDYLEFFGKKNTSELDRHLFKNPEEEMMNPRYSLFTDSSAYFLTWSAAASPKRFENIQNDLTNLPPKEASYFAEREYNYFSQFNKKQNSQGVSSSDYGVSEGFTSNLNNVSNFTLNTTFPAPGNGKLLIRYSCNGGQHQQLISLNGNPLITDEFFDYQVRQLEFDLSESTLASSMALKFEGLAANTDRSRIANLILQYPRQFKFENKPFYFFDIAESTGVKYLEIENFSSGGVAPVLYDLTNGQRMITTLEGNIVKIALPPSPVTRKLVLVNGSTGIKTPPSFSPVEFIDYQNINANFIFLSNPRLYDDGNGNNWVQEYADYRSSADGGGYSTVIVDVQQLYDQFGWGLNRHPLSIRNFGHYVKREWEDVQYFFVVGKGREYRNVRTAAQLANASNETFYVPTFGFPGSDNQLLAGEDGFTPVIPLGRIAVSTVDDIRVYLDKVKEFEGNVNLPQTIEGRGWMKNVLHLGGGNGASPSEQSIIRSNLEHMASILKQGKMGASIQAFYKTSTDPIQQPQTETIFDYISNGISLITFFGHSAVTGFDFSIDFPENWKNKGKYPWMVALGCYSGNIHTGSVGVGERFVFLKDAGSIAFSATSGQGYISSLNTFTSYMYGQLGGDLYGESLGKIIQLSISYFQGNDFGVNLIRQQFNFLGDPSINMNPAPSPDYLIDASSVKFTPQQVNAGQQDFKLSFSVANIGMNQQDSIRLFAEQQMPDASRITVVDTLVKAPEYADTYEFNVPVPGKNSIGLNRFFVKADASDRVQELPFPQAESNNELVMFNGELGTTLFIRDNSAIPAFPQEFGIVGANDFTLKAFTTDPLAPIRKYLIQIDTTELFNSPVLLNTEITQSGGVIRWKPDMNWQDETVYYWRISPDSLSPNEGFNWNNSSFLYKVGSLGGWSQSHFFQFKKDELVNLELDGHGGMEYLQNFKDIVIKNSAYNINRASVSINNAVRSLHWPFTNSGIYVLWLDSVFVEPIYNSPPGQGPISFGIPHPWGISTEAIIFHTNTVENRADLVEFLSDVVSDGDYIILYTVQLNPSSSFMPENWAIDSLSIGENIFSVLEKQGAQQVRSLETGGSRPYSLVYRKGYGIIGEKIANNANEITELFVSISGNWDRGFVNSTEIGPATSWEKLEWQHSSVSNAEADTVGINIYGLKKQYGEQVLLYENVMDKEFNLSGIDADEYPYIVLRFNSEDSLFRTSANLDHWRIIYEGVPEFTFNPAEKFRLEKDTIQTGEPLELTYQVDNLSNNAGDSLLVKYTVIDVNNKQTLIYQRLPIIDANSSKIAELSIDTRNNKGRQNLLVELNPYEDQPEFIYSNNFLQTTYFAKGDIRNPLLEVTFNGIPIIDGELVSPTPDIRISLSDENEFLLLDDTSLFKLFILYPDSVQPTPIVFSSPEIRFTPAVATGNNKASIEFAPIFTADGTYSLLVQAKDVSGNSSGGYDFKRSFKVITTSSISNFVNYPNPFSTSTRFVYTLTGAGPPAKYKMQIMTVSGRLIREVSQQELGELKTGTHLTDFAWDGKDEFGDQLANGVYLYRLVMEDENEEVWKTYKTGVDRFFKAGIGKMVLIR